VAEGLALRRELEMIWESGPWKQELQRLSHTIRTEAAKDVDGMDGRREFKLEQAIFYSAFVVRKLIENKKLTDETAGHSIEVTGFRSRRSKVASLSFAGTTSCDFDKEYDLKKPFRLRMSPSDLAGEIIHSQKLMWEISDQGCVVGAYLCSYRKAEDRLILLPLELLCSLLGRVSKDEITQWRAKRHTMPTTDGKSERVVIKYSLK
jgi:hypothetical protein